MSIADQDLSRWNCLLRAIADSWQEWPTMILNQRFSNCAMLCLVAQSCQLCDPVDCSHVDYCRSCGQETLSMGILSKNAGVGSAMPFSGSSYLSRQ